jgi:gliding motility-associated-like protein
MATIKRKFLFLLVAVLSVTLLNAQITVTSPVPGNLTFNSETAAGSIVFGIKNTNAAAVTITEVGNYVPANFTGTLTLWYHPTAITGAPTAINTTNGWVQVATGVVASSTTAGIRPVFTGLNLSLPANTIYRFAISGPANSPFYGGAGTTPNSYSSGGLEIYVQDNPNSPGYGGAFPGPPTNTPRSFIGSVTFTPTAACSEPPVAGTAVASAALVCSGGSFNLNLTGNSIGTNQTYQWQHSTDEASWSNVGTSSTNSFYTTTQTATGFYRAAVTCGTSTVFSSSVKVVTASVSGTYTINSALPTDGTNFKSFSDAVTALRCGITGSVVFNVAAGSGPYNEQISIPSIPGADANKTITFNGNGATIQFSPVDGARHIIRLDGADYITFNNLKIVSQSATYGWGIHLINGADQNRINNCTIDVSSVTSTTAANSAGIVASGSTTSVTTAGSASNNTISNNTIIGGNRGVIIYGATNSLNAVRNSITNNIIKDFYATGVLLNNNDGAVVSYNDINRAGAIAVGAFIGIEVGAGNKNLVVNANRIHDTHTSASTLTGAAYGIEFTSCDAPAGSENKVTNNLIYNFNSGSGTIYGLYNSGSDGVHYFHNTVVLDYAGATAGITRGFYQLTSASNIQLKNNIIYISRGGDGTKYCLYLGTTGSSIVSNKNVLFNSSIEGTNGIGYRTSGFPTLAEWKTANSSAYDQQSVSVNPQFQNAVTGNFKPLDGSFDNIGDNVGVSKDVLDATRAVNTPDPGAYEFDYAACSGTPVAGTAVSSHSTVCVEPFTLSLTGATASEGITYQWQSSKDNVSWTDIFDATTRGLTTTQMTTTYYRAILTCANGGASATSTSVMVASPALVSGTFTINKNAPTGGSNFQSFNDAYNHIKCGIDNKVIFNVVAGSGPYEEQLIMSEVPGASANNTITFNGNGNTLSFLAKNTNERAVIKLYGADYITFDNLTIKALGATTSDYGFGVQLLNDADFNTINNCIINIDSTSSSTNFAGIVVSNSPTSATGTGTAKCDNNTFSNNTINGGYYGLTLVGSSTEANGSNKIINNTIKNFYTYGIFVNGSFNTLIERNTVTRPERTTVSTFYGIYFTGLSTKANITKNIIANPFGGATSSTGDFYGIYFGSVATLATFENIVSNNLIYNLNGNGDAYGIYNSASSSAWYYHNTISIDGSATASTDTEVTRGFYQTSTANGLEFKNNIITISRGGLSAKTAIYLNAAATTIVSDKNIYYISSATGVRNLGFFGTPHATLAEWRAATSNDMQSVVSNPIYKDPAAGNFTPQNAAIDNIGVPVGITTDITSAARSNTTPDVGAYEFTPEPCTGAPVAGTATVSETPVCPETSVMLSVVGNSFGAGQTFQWQTSFTETGTYDNLGGVLSTPDTTILAPSNTLYYRVAVTCGGQTSYSAPVLLSVTDPLAAGTYTINNTKPASANNFISFNAAKEAMGCGIAGPVVFNVETGSNPYEEQLILGPIRGASDLNTITFNGNGNTIKFSSSESAERAVIKLNGAKYITFDNLVIDATGTGTYGYGIQFINDADSNVVKNSTININKTSTSSTNFGGIIINSSATSITTAGTALCDFNTLTGNTINGGYYGVAIVSGTTPYVENNSITNNKIYDFYAYGIYLAGNSHTLVESNELARPTRTNSTTTYAIYATGLSEGLRISKNRIHNGFGSMTTATNAFYGIYFSGVDAPDDNENVITNNLIYNLNGNGGAYGIYNSSSNNAIYYHNTISLDVAASTTTSTTYGIWQTGEAENIDIKNNLITISRGGTGTKIAMYFPTATTKFAADYNNFYVSGTAAHIGYYSGTNRTTLAAWQATAGKDLTSSNIDPLYTSPASGNFKPNSPSLDNRGSNVAIATDIEGAARNTSAPDIGAYEFNVPPCTTPPIAGATKAFPSTGICMGTQVLLSLDGNTFGSGMSFQWEYATTASGTYSPLGAPKMFPDTLIEASGTLYYRAAVTCSGVTTYSSPVLVTINPAFLTGVYTIDPAQPVSATNFQSFTTAVAALECGITGPVTFMVAPGTYTEQIRMKRISGAAENSRVTFQSADGNQASVTLTFGSKDEVKNYVLKLDSASYITYKDMTITAKDSVYGRVIELANTASYDSLVNLVINAPVNDTIATSVVGIYANSLKGGNHVIKGNTIRNGSNGIYFRGTSTVNMTARNVIDSNTITGAYNYGINTYYTSRIRVTKNKVSATAPLNSTYYGIYNGYADTAYQVVGNTMDINNTTGTVYGIYTYYSDGTTKELGRVANNTVLATGNNTGTIYGLSNYYSTYNNTVNNVVSIHTSGASSYALYSYQGDRINYYNNSINSTATSATNNHAGYFYHTSGSVDVRNNIFSHNGGGRAFFTQSPDFTFSDYNMLFTNGAVLVQQGTPAVSFANLQAWRNATLWDVNSIVYKPAFISNTDLQPNVADSHVWAMHGRGVQILEHAYDFNNNPRPTTLTAGVPDLGAYEFVPTSEPPVLTAVPAAPVAGGTQTFMFGTDTVSKITWAPGAPVPSAISIKRYSGVTPPGLTSSTSYMYYYTDVQTTGAGAFNFSKKDFFVDSWQGFVNHQYQIRLGRTDASAAWTVGANSSVDTVANVITEDNLTGLFQFTGLADVNVTPPPPPVFTKQIDSSNMGKRFWVGYANSYDFSSNSQDMVLYLSTGAEPATVTVRVNGTSWTRTYTIPAFTAITSDKMPKAGMNDSRLTEEGQFKQGISIESDVPIVAYAHIYASTNSGATMLLPVGTYGYEYYTLNAKQTYSTTRAHSSFFVVADQDNTVVEITPANPTAGGKAANVPFTVTLNRGEVYQVLGAYISGSDGYDLSGSKIKSIPNADGKCYPIGVFAGSSRTRLTCGTGTTGGGDLLFQQVFPSQAWGTRYLTAPTSIAATASSVQTNIYRVMVKDAATVVNVNGVQLNNGSLINNRYYQFESNTADYITANKPIMVAQYMGSSGTSSGCLGSTTTSDGDPELFYLSPLEQAIKSTVFYRNTVTAIRVNYLTLTIPTEGVKTLTVDGSNSFDHVYAHPNLSGYSVVVKRWGNTSGQSIIRSDSAFTGIVYGEGSQESYGYNVGTLVKNLNVLSSITNTLSTTGGSNEFTCAKAPFKVSVLIPVMPTKLTWNFSQVTGITPNADVTINNPVPVGTVVINGKTYYKYELSQEYAFSNTGTFNIPISYTHPEVEGCNNTLETVLPVRVVAAPLTDFTINYTNCIGDVAQFAGSGGTGVTVTKWEWTFGDGGTAAIQNPTKQYAAAGTYDVTLKLVTPDGCLGEMKKPVSVNNRPVVTVVSDSLANCAGGTVKLAVKDPVTGVTYNWYDASTGGTLKGTGSEVTVTVNGSTEYYVEAVMNSCASTTRQRVKVQQLSVLTAPVVTVDSTGTDMLRFKWSAIPGATGYEVWTSRNQVWETPSTGSNGLTHSVTGLMPLDTVRLIVRVKGGCQDVQSIAVTGKAFIDQVFIPNSFSPNGDGLNDVLQVYGDVIKEMQFMVFNQWGERIYESRDLKRAWDGTSKGKLQPAGVYMYVSKLVLNDGTVIQKKGSINLIR